MLLCWMLLNYYIKTILFQGGSVRRYFVNMLGNSVKAEVTLFLRHTLQFKQLQSCKNILISVCVAMFVIGSLLCYIKLV